MTNTVSVRRGTYRDSITLLRISKEVGKVAGVRSAAVVMATPLNKRVLADAGFNAQDFVAAGSDDLVVAIEAESEETLAAASAKADEELASASKLAVEKRMPSSLAEAMSENPDSNLVVISIPGAYAKREATRALEGGMNVFLFSSNVPRSDEVFLKELAASRQLLMMGPDCGSAMVNGNVLGFGNSVRRGGVGIVSASGTGLQEVATLVHEFGSGVSQAIGTGGGDLSDEVGGIMTLKGLELLESDEMTEVIVVISKPPGPKAELRVLERFRKLKKPLVVCFLGTSPGSIPGLRVAGTLESAAAVACELLGKGAIHRSQSDQFSIASGESSRLHDEQKYVRGLFAGGTLCYESQAILIPMLGTIYSNSPIDKAARVDGTVKSKENCCIDMGGEEFVVGRAHPMIDFTLRNLRILEEARDPETAVILLDVELGVGSNPDPASELVPAISKARSVAMGRGRYLPIVASIVGTEDDFQGLSGQQAALRGAGVVLCPSSAEAATLAGLIATRGERAPLPAEVH